MKKIKKTIKKIRILIIIYNKVILNHYLLMKQDQNYKK